ncbi:YbjN domain-containing protein [Scytonema sp. UIC 10036]|uniref:YbjN domain-containing protein n=1 Tax=Scytonema sp. UIC 10036 TaxID=2304196 RepID=UPI0012DA8EE5|nr:YbjN domain-containing protein [Scytonema sp. UIC 10036]MUG97832.1 YbjN domain-containing protein [Scytonema sp. UIC 10036]
MIATTKKPQLKTEITLHDFSQSPLKISLLTLNLTKQNDQLIECRLTFQVDIELYDRIDTDALFNLIPNVRNPLSTEKFIPEQDIKIEISLKPDWFPHLVKHAANNDEAATYIQNLSEKQPAHPILSTDSWLALSVTQQQESGEIGYRTLWSYISPANLAQASTSSKEISQGIINFFKDWTEANLSTRTKKPSSKMLEGISHFLIEVADINLDEIAQQIEANIKRPSTSEAIFEEMVNFFKADDWSFIQIEGQPVLQIVFQGENGKWTCYASTKIEQQQFIFYSLCSVNAPEDKRLAVAEFLTRANSGMVIGNFELDFANGEIRYKTSIDVQGDRLSFALIKRLVYANVTMMDRYLPGIMSVIYDDMSPEDA